jgi:hypothetical protein
MASITMCKTPAGQINHYAGKHVILDWATAEVAFNNG